MPIRGGNILEEDEDESFGLLQTQQAIHDVTLSHRHLDIHSSIDNPGIFLYLFGS